MIGTHPTIGCLIILDKAAFTGVEPIVQVLQRFIPISGWHCSEAGPSPGRAALGGEMPEMIVTAQESDERAFIQFEFDEDEAVHLADDEALFGTTVPALRPSGKNASGGSGGRRGL